MYIIVIANGQFPVSRQVLDLLGEADRVVCCDGAFEKFFCWHRQSYGRGRMVEVVGDGDSLSPSVLDEARQAGVDVRRKVVSEQESNDLSKAVHYAIGKARSEDCADSEMRLDILGATGLREDHALGNISLLAYYTIEFPQVEFRMVSDYGVFVPVRGRRVFKSCTGQQVSIFSFTPTVPVSVSGLRYPIVNRPLTWLWEGTLNEALGDEFEVAGGTLVVYVSWELKITATSIGRHSSTVR